MNYSTAIFLINDQVRAIKVGYDPESTRPLGQDDRVLKTLDQTIKKDDYVVVPTGTRHGMTVCKVKEVDINLDLDSPVQIEWAIGKVDKDAFDKLVAEEAVAVDTIKSAETRQKRDALRQALFKDQEEKFKSLALSHVSE